MWYVKQNKKRQNFYQWFWKSIMFKNICLSEKKQNKNYFYLKKPFTPPSSISVNQILLIIIKVFPCSLYFFDNNFILWRWTFHVKSALSKNKNIKLHFDNWLFLLKISYFSLLFLKLIVSGCLLTLLIVLLLL